MGTVVEPASSGTLLPPVKTQPFCPGNLSFKIRVYGLPAACFYLITIFVTAFKMKYYDG
jgi:hypothetical protein